MRKIQRLKTVYFVSDGVEKLRRKMKYKTLFPLRSKGFAKTRKCPRVKNRECFEITLTKKGVKALRKKK